MDNITTWMIYLYGIYPNIKGSVSLILFLMMFIVPISLALILMSINDGALEKKHFFKTLKIEVLVFIVLGIINTMLPPRNIVVAMFALEPAKEIINNVTDSNRTNKVMDTLDNYIEYINKKSKELK